MLSVPITVTIPVGPEPHHRRWFHEALASIRGQTVLPHEVLIIEDGHDSLLDTVGVHTPRLHVHSTPWRAGVPHAFNSGVALATHDLVLMMGSDDELLPGCIAACWQAWQEWRDPFGYYYLGVRYHDGREQNTPCNAAMVHKDLWQRTGGFPPESALGACDTWLIGLLMTRPDIGNIYAVDPTQTHYRYREHPQTETAQKQGYWDLMVQARDRWTMAMAERVPHYDSD